MAEHHINVAGVNFNFNDPAMAAQFDREGESYLKKQMLVALDKVFDELSLADKVITIDHLKLELGTIHCNGSMAQFYAELDNRIAASARQQLMALLPGAGDSASPGISIRNQSNSQTRLQPALLQQILILALLEGKHRSLYTHWSQIAEQPKLLDTTIRYYGRQLKIRRLIVSLFSEPMLGDTLVALEPQAHGFVRQIIDQPQLFQQALKNSANRVVEPTVNDLKQRLWLFTLGYLLVDRGSEFNRKSYLNSLLHQQAQHHSLDYADLLSNLAEVVATMPPTGGLQQQLHQLLQQLLQQQQVHNGESPARQIEQSQTDEAPQTEHPESGYYQLLVDALLYGKIDVLKPQWPTLYQNHSMWLRAVLMDIGQQVVARKRLSEDFEVTLLHQVYDLLADRQSPFIIEFINQNQLLGDALKPQPTEQKPAKPAMPDKPVPKQLLNYFTLTYLIVDRGSEFNRQSYMHSVIKQLAAHHNMASRQLVLSLHGLLSKLAKPVGVLASLYQLVQGLVDKRSKSETGQTDATEQGTHLQGYQQYQVLSDYLCCAQHSGQSRPSPAALVETLRQLSQKAPLLTLRLWRDIKTACASGKLSLDTVAKQLDATLFMALVTSHFSLIGGGRTDGLLATIKRHIGQVNDKTRYYARLLDCLMKGHVFDFEKLLAGLLSPGAQRAESDKLSRNPPKPEPSSPRPISVTLQEIINYLTSSEQPIKLSAEQQRQWCRLIEQHLDQSYSGFAYMLQPCWREKRSIDRLIALLPQPLLLRLMMALKPRDITRLMSSAETLMLAVQPLLANSSNEKAQQLKWQFIIQYLLQQGRAHSPHNFVPRFAHFLWSHSTVATVQQFSQQLQKQLTSHSQPGREALFKSLAGILENDSKVATIEENTPEQQPLEAMETGDQIAIENAGLILAGAFIPMLFKRLEWIEEGLIKDSETAERAIHLLQYMVTGLCETPEQQLVLNKLLCGIALDQPITGQMDLSNEEKEMTDQLVATMNSHWGVSPNTSVAGFKQTFLQRKGVLEKLKDGWQLKVQYQAIDILRTTKDIPWNYSLILFKWSEDPIHVIWDKTTEQL